MTPTPKDYARQHVPLREKPVAAQALAWWQRHTERPIKQPVQVAGTNDRRTTVSNTPYKFSIGYTGKKDPRIALLVRTDHNPGFISIPIRDAHSFADAVVDATEAFLVELQASAPRGPGQS